MATYFVISDVHSFYNEMMKALNEAGYDKTNKKIFYLYIVLKEGEIL